jgi:hypothetical protein
MDSLNPQDANSTQERSTDARFRTVRTTGNYEGVRVATTWTRNILNVHYDEANDLEAVPHQDHPERIMMSRVVQMTSGGTVSFVTG